ncbi:P-II family nitrogen regulator [Candidatus Saganbacteria bacterium]|nr:P-II family nitrogen regulator [Candidatus Saganbacteria bacterium]
MKKIEAIIRVEKLEEVKNALEEKGIIGMTVTEVKGRGTQKGILLEWRAGEYRVEFLPKLKVEVVVKESDADAVVKAIADAARTGRAGDGKIFISTIEAVVRVRTGESGQTAL